MKTHLDHLEEESRKIRLTDAERSAIRARLVLEMRVLPAGIPSPYTRFLRSFAYIQRPVFAALLILILAGGGTAFAAERSLPGDAFYGVKVAVIEPAIGALQSTPAAQADWQVHLAQTRLAEASIVANSPSVASSTKVALATRVAVASTMAAEDIGSLADTDPSAASEAATSLDDAFTAHTAALAALAGSADASATPVLAAALSSTVAPVATTLAVNTAEPASAPAPAATVQPAVMMAPMKMAGSSTPEVSTSALSVSAAAEATTTATSTEEKRVYARASALFAHTRALARVQVLH